MVMQKLASAAATIALIAARADAQVIFDPDTNTFNCPLTGGSYCAGASLTSNFIIRCAGFIGDPEDCKNQLFGVFPIGIKDFALCYQVDPAIGNASCSLDGTVYPGNGEPFSIPDLSTAANSVGGSRYGFKVTPQSLAEGTTTPIPVFDSTGPEIPIPPSTVDVGVPGDINGGFLADRECGPDDPLPESALEGLCNFPSATPAVLIRQSTVDVGVPGDINGGFLADRECGPDDPLPESALEGLCNFPSGAPELTSSDTSNPYSAKREYALNDANNSSSTKQEGSINGTSNFETGAPTVAPYTGSANMYGAGMCAVGAGVLAIMSFVLAN